MLQINEIGSISERIMKLVEHFCQGNKTAFGRAADIQSGVLAGIVGGRESKPGFEILQKLLTAYPTVNPTWLLFGRGPMINDGESQAEFIATSNDKVDDLFSVVQKQMGIFLDLLPSDQSKKLKDGLEKGGVPLTRKP
ncbi:hypothetical protein [Hymenobacter bucti]|uniref:XRE family transcriptional regulator n=1 Tax=Hymenobacter bucti TaxID=1844114 RepID=A0ABW4QX03_9BACT